jgi:hypothetical protein
LQQAVWRFYANASTTLSKLSEPLLASSLDGIETYGGVYALVVHDWSLLNYNTHASKLDRKVVKGNKLQGYELQTRLVLNDNNGLAAQLQAQPLARTVQYKGKTAYQTIAECEVVVTRPAQPKRQTALIKGEPFNARLLVSRILDAHQHGLAQWYLLSNVPNVPPDTLALWYYWRWQIECFFKRLKQQGLHLEDWQQESGLAIAKRLLIASQACVIVWQLRQQNTPEAEEFKHFLVRLSGRQMKKNQPITAPALFDGLWLFLSLMDTLEHYPVEQLQQFRHHIRAFWFEDEVV